MFNFSFLFWSSFSYILHYEGLYDSFVYFYCLALAWKDNAIGPVSQPITRVKRILIQPSNNCRICQDSGTSVIPSKPQVSQRNKLTLFIFHVRLPSLENFASRLCTKKGTRGKEKHNKSTCRFTDPYASLASMAVIFPVQSHRLKWEWPGCFHESNLTSFSRFLLNRLVCLPLLQMRLWSETVPCSWRDYRICC